MPCRRRTRRRFQASFRRMDNCIFWRLGFRQSSLFHHITRVPQRVAPYAWTRPLIGCHAAFPFVFRLQVRHQTQEPPSEFLPAPLGIRQGASWRIMLLSPTTPFQGPGQPSDPETSPLVSARCAGDTPVRLMAHRLIWALRHPRARAREGDPTFITDIRIERDLGIPSVSLNTLTGCRSCAPEDCRRYFPTLRQGPAPVSCVFPAGDRLHLLETGLQEVRPLPYRAGLPARRSVRLGSDRRFPGMLRSLSPHGSG
jgi:hypothetical protein